MPRTDCTGCRQVRECLICPKCNSAAYCSDVCREKDARCHGILCKDFAFRSTSTPRPSKTCTLAFYFPVQGWGPEVIWFQDGQRLDKDATTGVFSCSNLFDNHTMDVETINIDLSSDPYVCSKLKCSLETHMIQHRRLDTTSLNETLLQATGGQQHCLYLGPVVLCGLVDKSPGLRRDVTMSNFSAFINDIQSCTSFDRLGAAMRSGKLQEIEAQKPSLFTIILKPRSREVVQGVEITGPQCTVERFIPVDVPDSHPIFHGLKSYPAPISTRVGLPLLIRGISQALLLDTPMNESDLRAGLSAQILNFSVDPQEYDFGAPSWEDSYGGWLGGRVLVVREDKRPITPNQVEAMVHFCREVLTVINDQRPKVEGSAGKDIRVVARRKEVIQDWMCRGRFEQFFHTFGRKKIQGGKHEWADEVTPYEMVAEAKKEKKAPRI